MKYREIIFEDALYLPDIDVNLFNGLKYYKSRGYLEKNRLYIFQRRIITRLNIVKTGFFIPLKGYKSRSAFINFCFSFYRDDSYISIPARPLKAGPIKPNALERGTPKPGLHRPKDRQRSEILEGINIGNNSFKDSSSWESIERGPRMPEDRPCKPVESQEITIGPEQASIDGLNPETSRGTAKERPYIFAEPRDVEETDDTYRNPRGYNALLQLTNLWHIRLGHLGLNLLKKTVKIINGIPNLNVVKKEDLVYLAYDRNKAVKRPNLKVFPNLLKILNTLKEDIFKIKPKPYNKRPIRLFIINRKSRFKWMILLPNRQRPTVFNAIQNLFNGFKNRNYRYPTRFHFDNSNEINSLLQAWFQTIGTSFNISTPYTYEQNGLIERSIRVLMDCLKATLQWAGLLYFL